MKRIKWFFFGLSAALTAGVLAATFNVFGPVTGILKGNANSPQTTAAVSSDVIALWTGTCNGTTALGGAGGCISTGGTSANPSAKVELSAVNGTATTFMTSDSSPPLDQTISPTWTGLHTFTPTATTASGVTVNQASCTGCGTWAETINGNSTSGSSLGLEVLAGFTSADSSVLFCNHANTACGLGVSGDMSGFIGPNSKNPLSWDANAGYFAGPPSTAEGTLLLTGASNAYTLQVTGGTTSSESDGVLITAGTTASDAALNVRNSGAGETLEALFGNGNFILGVNCLSASTMTGSATASPALQLNAPCANAHTLNVLGAANTSASFMVEFLGSASATTGTSDGLFIQAGTNASDAPLVIDNLAGTKQLFEITGAGSATSIVGYGATAAGNVDMTPDKGTFTITLTGCSATTTGTAIWSKQGNQITLGIPVLTCTSSTTAATLTGLPTEIEPTHAQNLVIEVENNTGGAAGLAQLAASSTTITLCSSVAVGGCAAWIGSGTKGIPYGNDITYLLN